MAYNILELVNSEITSLKDNDAYKLFEEKQKLIKKLESISEDISKLDNLTDEDIALLDDKSKKIILFMKKCKAANILDIEDSVKTIDLIKEALSLAISENKEITTVLEQLSSKTELQTEFSRSVLENFDRQIDYLGECFESKKISFVEAVEYIKSIRIQCEKILLNEEEVIEESIAVNTEDIYEKLVKEFKKYHYDFDELAPKTKDLFNKYTNIKNVTKVLKKLSKYGVDQKILLKHQSSILNIVIDYANSTLDLICDFIDQNDCTLTNILSLSAVFHKANRRYSAVDSNPRKKGPPKEPTITEIQGNYDAFMANIELVMEKNGVTKVTDELLNTRVKTFVNTPHDKVLENIRILKAYKIIDDDELPTLSALIGKFTAYQLDRFIEVGLFDYIKENVTYVNATNNPFKFYKIRRAQDLDIPYISKNGIIGEIMTSSAEFCGISQNSENRKIYQVPLSIEGMDFSRLRISMKNMGTRAKIKNPVTLKKFDEDIYFRNYKYRTFNPNYIWNYSQNKSMSLIINTIFRDDYELQADYDIEKIKNDPYFQKIEELFLTNEHTYEIKLVDTANQTVRISRMKVIRLINLLKKHNYWINNDTSVEDATNIILSILVKDSVISKYEYSSIKNAISPLVVELSNSYTYGKGY